MASGKLLGSWAVVSSGEGWTGDMTTLGLSWSSGSGANHRSAAGLLAQDAIDKPSRLIKR